MQGGGAFNKAGAGAFNNAPTKENHFDGINMTPYTLLIFTMNKQV